MSPALAGGVLTTAPPGKSPDLIFFSSKISIPFFCLFVSISLLEIPPSVHSLCPSLPLLNILIIAILKFLSINSIILSPLDLFLLTVLSSSLVHISQLLHVSSNFCLFSGHCGYDAESLDYLLLRSLIIFFFFSGRQLPLF